LIVVGKGSEAGCKRDVAEDRRSRRRSRCLCVNNSAI
jgi:hypothetical protein